MSLTPIYDDLMREFEGIVSGGDAAKATAADAVPAEAAAHTDN